MKSQIVACLIGDVHPSVAHLMRGVLIDLQVKNEARITWWRFLPYLKHLIWGQPHVIWREDNGLILNAVQVTERCTSNCQSLNDKRNDSKARDLTSPISIVFEKEDLKDMGSGSKRTKLDTNTIKKSKSKSRAACFLASMTTRLKYEWWTREADAVLTENELVRIVSHPNFLLYEWPILLQLCTTPIA